MRKASNPYLSIPNILSYFRILLLPFLIWLQIKPHSAANMYWSGLIILASGISDFLDGYIARRYDQVTEFGKIIDPVADKLTQLALVVCLYLKHPVILPLLVLFVFKELYTAGFSVILLRRGVKIDGAKWYGKVSTTVFYISMIIIFFHPAVSPKLLRILVAITSAFMFLAFVLYARLMYLMWEESRNNPKQSVKDQVRIITEEPGLPVRQTLRRPPGEKKPCRLKLPYRQNRRNKISGRIFMFHRPPEDSRNPQDKSLKLKITSRRINGKFIKEYFHKIKNTNPPIKSVKTGKDQIYDKIYEKEGKNES